MSPRPLLMVNGADDPRCPIDGVRAAVAAAAALGGAGGEEGGGGWPLALHAEVRRDGACLSRSRIRTLPHKAARETVTRYTRRGPS